ncbi:hypothetical protein ACHAXA_009022 [Cyclostephanos tholiformis]|uniref:Uncharacterized protein n=1 Tax=Cyclostephanos tholiformis TaxID=382380 RepID=A0ABD3RDH2_9STRA
MDNILDNLLYADSKNCALLKEVAMDFITRNKVEAMEKITFIDAPGTLMRDLLASVARRETTGLSTIVELRRRAHSEGLDIDDSRDMLVAALRSRNLKKQRTS